MQYGDISERVEEGVAIFSKLPFLSADYILLERDLRANDQHQRIVLRATLELPGYPMNSASVNRSVDVMVTHFSLTAKARRWAVEDLCRWTTSESFTTSHQVLMGDMNALPTEMEELDVSGRCGLEDLWPQTSNDPGLTFSTLDANLSKRIDYIYASASLRATSANILVEGTEEVHASDHAALLGVYTVADGY